MYDATIGKVALTPEHLDRESEERGGWTTRKGGSEPRW